MAIFRIFMWYYGIFQFYFRSQDKIFSGLKKGVSRMRGGSTAIQLPRLWQKHVMLVFTEQFQKCFLTCKISRRANSERGEGSFVFPSHLFNIIRLEKLQIIKNQPWEIDLRNRRGGGVGGRCVTGWTSVWGFIDPICITWNPLRGSNLFTFPSFFLKKNWYIDNFIIEPIFQRHKKYRL